MIHLNFYERWEILSRFFSLAFGYYQPHAGKSFLCCVSFVHLSRGGLHCGSVEGLSTVSAAGWPSMCSSDALLGWTELPAGLLSSGVVLPGRVLPLRMNAGPFTFSILRRTLGLVCRWHWEEGTPWQLCLPIFKQGLSHHVFSFLMSFISPVVFLGKQFCFLSVPS